MPPLEGKQSHSLAFAVFRGLFGLLIAFHGFSKFPSLSSAAAKNLSGEPFFDGILPIFLLVGGLCIATGFAPPLVFRDLRQCHHGPPAVALCQQSGEVEPRAGQRCVGAVSGRSLVHCDPRTGTALR